jgi:anti-anti-sigma factor
MSDKDSGRREVYTMSARLDAVSAPGVEGDLLTLVEKGTELLICDFSGTSYVSSAGLRVMLLLTKKQRAAGRRFVLAGLQPEVADVFRMAGFEAIMEICASLQEVS